VLTELKRGLDSLLDWTWRTLPGAQANDRHVCARIEPYGLRNGHNNSIGGMASCGNKGEM